MAKKREETIYRSVNRGSERKGNVLRTLRWEKSEPGFELRLSDMPLALKKCSMWPSRREEPCSFVKNFCLLTWLAQSLAYSYIVGLISLSIKSTYFYAAPIKHTPLKSPCHCGPREVGKTKSPSGRGQI